MLEIIGIILLILAYYASGLKEKSDEIHDKSQFKDDDDFNFWDGFGSD